MCLHGVDGDSFAFDVYLIVSVEHVGDIYD
jgi:hypothetical protein